jgi:allantoicase
MKSGRMATALQMSTIGTVSDFRDLPDLASERLGGVVLFANDEFFAEKENLIRAAKPVWKEHEYTDRGKWMDGWESRRKRGPGHDFAIVRLGVPGVIRGVVVDTSFFRGNYPESCSIEGSSSADGPWEEILTRSPLKGDSENEFKVSSPLAWSHLRLNIFPDGGVARLRVHGEVMPDWSRTGGLGNEVDLAAIENGAVVLTCSDQFFGPKHNLIMPGRAHNMSDGWETRRRRGPGHDWVIVQLAVEGQIRRIEVDTNHFKGNYPDTTSIEGSTDGKEWFEILPRTKLEAHTRHHFRDELFASPPVRQIRLNVFPDGGVSRLRVWGMATEAGRHAAVVDRVNSAPDLQRLLFQCCGSTRWSDELAKSRPFRTWDALVEESDAIWSRLSPDDWQEAFRAHPRIGERKGSRWSSQEQSGTRSASPETMQRLADGNHAYEQKFGHIYLVCATGRSADDMLADLDQRMRHDAATELRVAAEEQRKITRLRLEKLVM